jgi:3-hydroxybenzoate 6-monooxygenase
VTDPINRPDAIIIGGGIGGLACAVGLTRKGTRVRLYEKSEEFGEVGAGLQLAPNCTRILDTYGLLEEAIELGVVPEHMRMLDALDGDELTHLALADVEKRYGFPYMVMHRSDLHGLLLREAWRLGVELITSADCVNYENVPGGARVSFTDGRTDEAEVVIAADGLHSVARRLLADDEPVNSAYVAYRGAVPFEAVDTSASSRWARRYLPGSASWPGGSVMTDPPGRSRSGWGTRNATGPRAGRAPTCRAPGSIGRQ